jgi:hypothetical protein
MKMARVLLLGAPGQLSDRVLKSLVGENTLAAPEEGVLSGSVEIGTFRSVQVGLELISCGGPHLSERARSTLKGAHGLVMVVSGDRADKPAMEQLAKNVDRAYADFGFIRSPPEPRTADASEEAFLPWCVFASSFTAATPLPEPELFEIFGLDEGTAPGLVIVGNDTEAYSLQRLFKHVSRSAVPRLRA